MPSNPIEVFPSKSVCRILDSFASNPYYPFTCTSFTLLLLLLLSRFFPLFDCRYSRVDSESEILCILRRVLPFNTQKLTVSRSPFLFLASYQRSKTNDVALICQWRNGAWFLLLSILPLALRRRALFEYCLLPRAKSFGLSFIQRDFLPSSNVSWFENGEINRVATWLSWLEGRTRSVAARDPCNVDFQTFPGLRVPSESFTNRIRSITSATWDLCSLLFFILYRFLDSSSFKRSLWKLINDDKEFRLPPCLHCYFNNV